MRQYSSARNSHELVPKIPQVLARAETGEAFNMALQHRTGAMGGSAVQIQFARAAKLAAVPTGESPVGGGAQMPP
jgi:hypothetical protein